MSKERPIRILQVVGGMNHGGVETWMMHVLRHIDRERFKMDFLVHTEKPCAYDDEIRALGSRIIPCMHPSRPLQYALNFRRVLHENGPYDVVHSHVHHFSGYVLWLASLSKIPVRIAHSHSDTSRLQAAASLPRRAYLSTTEYFVRRYATKGLAGSSEAGKSLFGDDPRWQTLYYGIDLTPFREKVNKAQVRGELGIPENAFVVGHVGRFVPVKNHQFIVEIASELFKKDKNVYIVLLGNGPLRSQTEKVVSDAGLSNQIIFAKLPGDVPQLMLGAMDIFLMPSLYEGLPVAALEAQAAGLRCVLSDTISREVSVVPDLVRWLSLSQSAAQWSETILSLRNEPKPLSQAEAISCMENSAMNILVSTRELSSLYDHEIK